MTSPTQRTLAHLRRLGYLAEVTEKRLPRCFITRDLFGILDVVALKPGEILGVQCTTVSNAAARMRKALALPELKTILEAGIAFEVWSWAKRGPRGKRKEWTVDRRPVVLADLNHLDEPDSATTHLSSKMPEAAGSRVPSQALASPNGFGQTRRTNPSELVQPDYPACPIPGTALAMVIADC